MTNFLLGGFTVLLVVAVYSCCLSVVDGDVQGAVVVEDSEDAEAVVAGDWEGEDVVEGASDAVLAGDGESPEADNLVCVCGLTFAFLLEASSSF